MKRIPSTLATLLFVLAVLTGCQQDGLVAPDLTDADRVESAVDLQQTLQARISNDKGFVTSDAAIDGATTYITEPTVITESGTYRVASDFTATGDGIVIQADDVELFLNGFTITGPGNKEGRGIVIDGARNVLVRDGIVSTFGIGVALVNAEASAVRKVEVLGGDEFADPGNGIAPQIGFLVLNSAENRLQGNSAAGVNLGIFVRGGGSYANRIQQNDLSAGTNGLLAICYNPDGSGDPAGPREDTVKLNTATGFGRGIQLSAGSEQNLFTLNTIEYTAVDFLDRNGSNVNVRNRFILAPGA